MDDDLRRQKKEFFDKLLTNLCIYKSNILNFLDIINIIIGYLDDENFQALIYQHYSELIDTEIYSSFQNNEVISMNYLSKKDKQFAIEFLSKLNEITPHEDYKNTITSLISELEQNLNNHK